MPKIAKTTDIPADPKRLYIYLYCDKLGCYKSTTKKKAAKSWLSLSESKRRKFLKTCRLKKELDDTQRVLCTEPFLKPLYSSTVEDSIENIKDYEKNEMCLDGDNRVTNDTHLDNNNVQQNKTLSNEQNQNKTSLDGANEVRNDTWVDNNNVQQNETCSNEQQHNKTSIDDDNEERNESLSENNNVQQSEIFSYEQQQNKMSLVNDHEERNETLLDINSVQQNETRLDDDNDDYNEQNPVIVVDESCNNNNDHNQQRDFKRHLDVNSLCKEINGSDTESLPDTDEQMNQGTKIDEGHADNSEKGFLNHIKEPIPPIVKNWRELFEVINKDKNIQFQDLSDSDKKTYQVLFTKIRREYIERYIQYLESLSNKQLYEHYLQETLES